MSLKSTFQYVVVSSIGIIFLIGCSHGYDNRSKTVKTSAIKSEIASKNGSDVRGWAKFTEVDGGVLMTAKIKGLDKNGVHGIHIHEYGDCSADDAKSAGGHFKPRSHSHGGPMSQSHHLGDLGNLEANRKGVAQVEKFIPEAKLDSSSKLSIKGKSLIVHKQKDDLESQPSGAAGDRIGCTVINNEKS